MTNRSDIEAFEETEGDHSNVPAIDNSFKSGSVNAPSRTSRTSKSAGSIMLTVDQNVLRMVTAEDFDNDDFDDRKDPCFGSCCDLVRACILVDIFYIFKNINIIFTVVFGLSHLDPDDYGMRELDDDQVQESVDRFDFVFIVLIIMNVCGILFASIGIFGACRFYKYLVLITAIWCCIDLVVSALTERYITAVMAAFFIYPNFALFFAFKNGRITRENYKGIQHCCCSGRCGRYCGGDKGTRD